MFRALTGSSAGLREEPSMVNTDSIWQKSVPPPAAKSTSQNSRDQEENKSRQQQPRLDEVAAQVLQEPQHKGRQGEAPVYDVHRMFVLGSSLKEARTRLLHLPFRQKEGEDMAPAGSVLLSSRRRLHGLHFCGHRRAQEVRVRWSLSALRT